MKKEGENKKREIKKVAVYARVSTGKQGESLEEQRRILGEYCDRGNYEIYKVYAEVTSGWKKEREAFSLMMREAERKMFDAIIVLKLDRFTRSMTELLNSLDRLKELGIEFIAVKDNIDTSSPQGKLTLYIMGALAEFERAVIYERTQEGIQRAKREGKICHRPRIEIRNIDTVKERLEQGIPLTEIAAMEKMSYGTLRNRLKEAGLTVKVVREMIGVSK